MDVFHQQSSLPITEHSKPTTQYLSTPDFVSNHWYGGRGQVTLAVREVLAGGKLLVTTLLCPRQTTKQALKALYRQRWHAELDLRCLKTTLGM